MQNARTGIASAGGRSDGRPWTSRQSDSRPSTSRHLGGSVPSTPRTPWRTDGRPPSTPRWRDTFGAADDIFGATWRSDGGASARHDEGAPVSTPRHIGSRARSRDASKPFTAAGSYEPPATLGSFTTTASGSAAGDWRSGLRTVPKRPGALHSRECGGSKQSQRLASQTVEDEDNFSHMHISEVRVAIEVQHTLIRFGELWAQPAGWTSRNCEVQRPLLKYFHNAVMKVILSLRVQVAQRTAQRSMMHWLSAKEEKLPEMPVIRTRTVVIDKLHADNCFWDSMGIAAQTLRNANADQRKDVRSPPDDLPSERCSMLADRVKEVESDWLRDRLRLPALRLDEKARASTRGAFDALWTEQENIDSTLDDERPISSSPHKVAPWPFSPDRSCHSKPDPSSTWRDLRASCTVGSQTTLRHWKVKEQTRVRDPKLGTIDEDEPKKMASKTMSGIAKTAPRRGTGKHPSFAAKAFRSSGVKLPILASAQPCKVQEKAEYAMRCSNAFKLAKKHDFLVHTDPIIDLAHQRLTDVDLGTLVEPIARRSSTEEIRLNGNRITSALPGLLQHIAPPRDPDGSALAKSLVMLDLSHNPLSNRSAQALATALATKRLLVKDLHLNGVPLAAESVRDICYAIIAAGPCIRQVGLADTQIGRQRQDSCIHAAKLCFSVPVLDLSHNYFRDKGMQALAKNLGNRGAKVCELAFAGNAWSHDGSGRSASNEHPASVSSTREMAPGEANPMLLLCEALGHNSSLQKLDISDCQLEVQATVCLEESLMVHPRLKTLDVSSNPVGFHGLRALLRILASKRSKLWQLTAQGLRRAESVDSVVYNPVDISVEHTGDAALRLWRPYHRAVLRLLLQRADDFGCTAADALLKYTIDGARRQPNFQKDTGGRWSVPEQGVASFEFELHVKDQFNSGHEVLVDDLRKKRLVVSLSKFVAILKMWRQLDHEEERILFMHAATRDLLFNSGQVNFMVLEAAEAMPHLLVDLITCFSVCLDRPSHNNLPGNLLVGAPERSVVTASLRNEKKIGKYSAKSPEAVAKTCMQKVENLIGFNPSSPTGAYSFDLANPCDYATADRLLTVARWEGAAAASKNLLDTTQLGGHLGLRNLKLDGRELIAGADWSLPGDGFTGEGRLGCDFVTPLSRPSKKTSPTLDAERFQEFLAVLDSPTLEEKSRFQATWATAHCFYLTALQLQEAISAISVRFVVDMFVILWPRCVEFGAPLCHGLKGLLVSEKLLSASISEVRSRLGHPNTFCTLTMHMRNMNFWKFDLSKRDERIIVMLILRLSLSEAGENLVDCHWTNISGACDTGYWTIPGRWMQDMPNSIPDFGVLSIGYACEKQNLMLEKRKALAKELLGWVETNPL